MGLLLGIAACLGLWWLFRKNSGKASGLDARGLGRLARRVGPWLLIGLAALMLLRGQLGLALILGLGGVWLLEGAQGLGRRLGAQGRRVAAADPLGALRRRWAAGRNPRPAQARSRLIALDLGPDGVPVAGRVAAGPWAGAPLEALRPDALGALRDLCAAQDPEGLRLLEAYLDRRRPGWRVDAEADRDPGPGRPPKPGAMTQDEAYQILGLQRGASADEVRTAHRGLMKSAHPDQGGSSERAARINAARDRLLYRHR